MKYKIKRKHFRSFSVPHRQSSAPRKEEKKLCIKAHTVGGKASFSKAATLEQHRTDASMRVSQNGTNRFSLGVIFFSSLHRIYVARRLFHHRHHIMRSQFFFFCSNTHTIVQWEDIWIKLAAPFELWTDDVCNACNVKEISPPKHKSGCCEGRKKSRESVRKYCIPPPLH